MRRATWKLWCWGAAIAITVGVARGDDDPSSTGMRQRIETFVEDLGALNRYFNFDLASDRAARLEGLFASTRDALMKVDYEALGPNERTDYALFRSHLDERMAQLEYDHKKLDAVSDWLPFLETVEALVADRQAILPIDGREAAETLDALSKTVEGLSARAKDADTEPLSPVLANRLAGYLSEIDRALDEWGTFYTGYDPEFTWWTETPLESLTEAIGGFRRTLRQDWAGFVDGEDPPLVGDPIGREALMESLRWERIPYTPEELVAIAESEFEWCRREYLKAAEELGYGEDWRAALEHVKNLHVAPGEQPTLIKEQADEAIAFLEERDLITIPPLAKMVWRMRMMSLERQKVSPYFTGGEVISVSFPLPEMSHEDKLMSLRGNNRHFCRAVTHHELIPGHHLQAFMMDRYNAHRRLFNTPFWVEGWALYWEMRLWDLDFPQSPEDRIGMLFWRSHRCARIIFSLNFHLGRMDAHEAIDFLVERVGHERRNATAEVRRSIQGGYSPLYQAAYMLGGLQIRAMHEELVASGRMTERAFHDGILQQNSIPIDYIRARFSETPIEKDRPIDWRFYGDVSVEPLGGVDEEDESAALGESPNGPDDDDPIARSNAWRGRVANKVFQLRVEPNWIGDSRRFWYRAQRGDSKSEFILVNATTGTQQPAFDHQALAEALAEQGIAAAPWSLPFREIEALAEGAIRFNVQGKAWIWDGSLTEADVSEGSRATADGGGRSRRGGGDPGTVSPDGKRRAFAKGDNLFVEDITTGEERRLTHDGNPGATFQRDVYADQSISMRFTMPDSEPGAVEVYWSPDSTKLIAIRTRVPMRRTVTIVESSPRDQLQPELVTYPYLKPGDAIPIEEPYLIDVVNASSQRLDSALFPNPWRLSRFRWDDDGSRATFLYNQRGHQVLRLLAVDADSADVSAVIEETSATFIDYAYKSYSRYLEETNEMLWMSERDGWCHLYLYDATTGALKNQVTRGEWVVRGVEYVDTENRTIWIRLAGIDPDQDPYYIHYARVDFDGSNFILLTESDGTHDAAFSPDRRFLVATHSRVNAAPVSELRDGETGALIRVLERADITGLSDMGWPIPEPFVAKGRDGETDIWGVIYRPSFFNPGDSYPVIEKIYAGPHGSFVPKSFRAYHSAQEMAELGAIVVQIDGMGTSNRSKAFHDVCWKNIGDAGFPDRIAWMRAAAAREPAMDIERVGIYGGSAGGQNALRALLAHGDFYGSAVSDCGCHDNRMDKIWWNELWMGWPVGPHYDEQSNVTQAHRLQGDLLLLVGEVDRNVDPASTMQVVDALVRANKDFDMLMLPGVGHGAAGTPYGKRRQKAFFLETLF